MKRYTLLALLLMLGAGPATMPTTKPAGRVVGVRLIANAPATVKQFFERAMLERESRRSRLQAQLKSDEATVLSLKRSHTDKSAIERASAQVAEDKKLIREASAPDFIPDMRPNLSYESDGATIACDVSVGWIGSPGLGKVVQIIDKDKAIVRLLYDDPTGQERSYLTALFVGIDAAKLVDGSRVVFPGTAEATSFRYTNTRGSETTIIRFDPIDLKPFIETIVQ